MLGRTAYIFLTPPPHLRSFITLAVSTRSRLRLGRYIGVILLLVRSRLAVVHTLTTLTVVEDINVTIYRLNRIECHRRCHPLNQRAISF